MFERVGGARPQGQRVRIVDGPEEGSEGYLIRRPVRDAESVMCMVRFPYGVRDFVVPRDSPLPFECLEPPYSL